MSNKTNLRFSRENMWMVGSFVLDSFDNHQSALVAVLGEGAFGADFKTRYTAALGKIKGATGAGGRIGAGTLVTDRLYANLDRVKPYSDKTDIRLGLLPAAELTVPTKDFKLKTLRERIDARDAEGVSRGLTKLLALVGANRKALDAKGYTDAERDELIGLQGLIDEDNLLQNSGSNNSQEATKVEDADYVAFDKLLGQLLRAARLLFKADKTKRRQYEQAALNKRVTAGEQPKVRE